MYTVSVMYTKRPLKRTVWKLENTPKTIAKAQAPEKAATVSDTGVGKKLKGNNTDNSIVAISSLQ